MVSTGIFKGGSGGFPPSILAAQASRRRCADLVFLEKPSVFRKNTVFLRFCAEKPVRTGFSGENPVCRVMPVRAG